MSGARRSGAERRVIEAFEDVHAPEDLKARTLARVEDARRAEKSEGVPDLPAGGQIVPFDARATRRRWLVPRAAVKTQEISLPLSAAAISERTGAFFTAMS